MERLDICIMQPDNFGLTCWNKSKCQNCGWNPEVEEERQREIAKKYGKEKEDD